MWMGPRGQERWVPCPAINMGNSRVGWGSTEVGINGNGMVFSSTSKHATYSMAWNATTRDNIRTLTDIFDGVYNTNLEYNPIYFIDPMAAGRNVLPQGWATPYLAAADAMPLQYGRRPTAVPTDTNDLGYPAMAAYYNLLPSLTKLSVYVPIPPGHTAWVGVHGNAPDGFIKVRPVNGNVVIPALNVPVQRVDDTERFSLSFPSGPQTGIELFLGAGSGWVAGMMVQILRNGVTPQSGGFISGQGHGGCEVVPGSVSQTGISAALDRAALGVELVETHAWR